TASVDQFLGRGGLAAVLEQVRGDVGEDHLSGRAESLQRAERDETVTGADVEECVTGPRLRAVEDLVADGIQVRGEILLAGSGVAAEPHVEQPPMPAVRAIAHNDPFCPQPVAAACPVRSPVTPGSA